MFERFTTAARDAVVGAVDEAGRLRHRSVGTEHLLLALIREPGTAALLNVTRDQVEAAIDREVSPSRIEISDAEALRAIGIDVDEVRARIEENFGPIPLEPPVRPTRKRFGLLRGRQTGPSSWGRRPFNPRTKKVLELSLREAIRLKSKVIGPEHLLLALFREGEGLAAKILVDRGADLADLHRRVEAGLRRAA